LPFTVVNEPVMLFGPVWMYVRPLPHTPERAANVNCTRPSGAELTRLASDCAPTVEPAATTSVAAATICLTRIMASFLR
jgi:hypothetical protein